jgi:hypothetical protein
MNGTHVIGTSIDSYNNSDPHYFYALRRNNDGDLYLCRVDINDNSEEVKLFGVDTPVEFENIAFPGEDYHNNRDPDTHELEYTTEQVKYEQWRWDNRFISYYLNDDGEFIVAIGKDIPLRSIDSIIPDSPTTQVPYYLYGVNSEVDVYKKLIELGWNGISAAVLINEGTLTSSNPNVPALTITGNFPNGLLVVNEGVIRGSRGFLTQDQVYNLPGNAVEVLRTCDFYNSGYIVGGLDIRSGDHATAIAGIDLIVELTNEGTIVGLAP